MRKFSLSVALLLLLLCVPAFAQLTLTYSRNFDYAGLDDIAYDVKATKAGDIWVLGKASLFYNEDSYVLLKYNSAGTFQFSRLMGANGIFQPDVVRPRLAVDTAGNAYLTCTTLSATAGLQALTQKYGTAGNLIYSKGYNLQPSAAGDDIPYAISVGPDNGAVVVGTGVVSGVQKGFIVKYDSSGNVLWHAEKTGGNAAAIRGLTIDASNNVYAIGDYQFTGGVGEIHTYKFNPSTGVTMWDQANPDGDDSVGLSVGIDPVRASIVGFGNKRLYGGGDSFGVFRRSPSDGSLQPADWFTSNLFNSGTVSFNTSQLFYGNSMAVAGDGSTYCIGDGSLNYTKCVAIGYGGWNYNTLSGMGYNDADPAYDAIAGEVAADRHGAGFLTYTIGSNPGSGNQDTFNVVRIFQGSTASYMWTGGAGLADMGVACDLDPNEDVVAVGQTYGMNGFDIVLLKLHQSPYVQPDTFDGFKNQTMTRTKTNGVKANDPGSDQGTVIQNTATTHGTLTLNADGSFTYIPNVNFVGADQFTYSVQKGADMAGPTTATIYIHPLLVSVSVPASIVGGETPDPTGSVTLSDNEADQGLPGTFSVSPQGVLVMPKNWYISSGNFTGPFSFKTQSVTQNTNVTVVAIYGSMTASTSTMVTPGGLSSFTMTPSTLVGGDTGSAKVVLSAATTNPAGADITLIPASPVSFASNTAHIAQNGTTATVSFFTKRVLTTTSVVVSATRGDVTRNVTMTILPLPNMTTFALSSATGYGGQNIPATITLDGIAPAAGITISLSSNQAHIVPPATVKVLAGQKSIAFDIPTTATASTVSGTVTATLGGRQLAANLTIYQSPTFTGFTVTSPVTGGNSTLGTITISSVATYGTLKFTVYSDDAVATMTRYITLAKGASSAHFTVNTTAVATQHNVTVTGTFQGVVKTAPLVVKP